jgi:hypothetical protein
LAASPSRHSCGRLSSTKHVAVGVELGRDHARRCRLSSTKHVAVGVELGRDHARRRAALQPPAKLTSPMCLPSND